MESKCVVHVLGPTEVPVKKLGEKERESDWSRQLSPFYLGPIDLYRDEVALNMENAWQYAKVYKQHTHNGAPTSDYWDWARAGWSNPSAVRFPMGRGAKPEYSLWDGQRLGYIEARKKIYAPLYAEAVEKTEGFKKLQELYESNKHIYLWDFDGYPMKNLTFTQVINDPNRPMGHAFVLAMCLTGEKVWMK